MSMRNRARVRSIEKRISSANEMPPALIFYRDLEGIYQTEADGSKKHISVAEMLERIAGYPVNAPPPVVISFLGPPDG